MAKKGKNIEKEDGGEIVDGPAAAAKILNHMSAANRERILGEITRIDEHLAEQIEGNLSSFDDLLDLSPQSIQKLLLEVDQNDLVLALKLCSKELRAYIEENMSDRKRSQVMDDLEALPPTPVHQVEAAQKRILDIMEHLRKQGLLRTRSKNDIYV